MASNAQQPTSVHIGPWNTSFYGLSTSTLGEFINAILDNNFINDVSKLFSQPIDNVISIRHYPFNAPMVSLGSITTTNSIVVNIHTITLSGYTAALMSNIAPPLIDLGGISIPVGTTFFDYAPYTKYELYLPYMGFVSLDTDHITGKYLNVKYAVDFNTGVATAYIQVKPTAVSDDNTNIVIMIKEAKIGVDIPICGGNSAEIAKSILGFGLKTAGSMTGLIGGAISHGMSGAVNVVDAATSSINFAADTSAGVIQAAQQRIVKGDVSNGYNATYGPSNMFLIKTTMKTDIPSSFNSMYGRLSRQTADMDEIGAGAGLVKLEEFHLDGFGTATAGELSMIANALREGVIL